MTQSRHGRSRREFLKQALQTSAALGASAWLPAHRVFADDAAASCAPPPEFPAGIEVYQQAFVNWAQDIRVDELWTCAPASPDDVVTLANWALRQGWRLRPRGAMHNWSPIHVTPDTRCGDPVLMVSTTEQLTALEMLPGEPARVRAQCGILVQDLLGFIEEAGYGLNNATAPGEITLGGALAIDAHGAAIPAVGEQAKPGHSYGSFSNLIDSVTAVVWDEDSASYRLRTFRRSDREYRVLAVCLGRAFITEAVLHVGVNDMLRCQSIMDVPYSELMGPPGSGRTYASYLDSAGRAEIIWFPFTEHPWFKVWSVSPEKPATSREVSEPYNYPFSDNIPDEIETLARSLVQGNKAATPTFGQMMYAVSLMGLIGTYSLDLWGPSKNTQHYIRSSTLRITASGHGIVTRRDNIQSVLYRYTEKYIELRDRYAADGEYPMNMPLEVRVNGLDNPADVGAADDDVALLSALSADPRHPDRDVVIWFNCLTMPGTELADAFYTELEQWIYAEFADEALVRPEWSKGWAYTPAGPWTNTELLEQAIPDGYRVGRRPPESWDAATRGLDRLDPQRIFSNDFLDRLLA